MQQLAAGFFTAFQRKDSQLVIIFSTLIFIGVLLAAQNGGSAYQLLGFDALPITKRISLALGTFFDFSSTFTTGTLILALFGSFLGGINVSLAYTYIRLRGEMLVRSGLYGGMGLVLALLGIGCAACGTAFLSLILGFFGLSAMLNVLPYQGLEIGYIGLLILCIATYTLAKKVGAPNVC